MLAKHTEAEKTLIRLALQDILASPNFVNSSQLSNFLSFIVKMKLEDKEEEIKGYTIGIDALGKPDNFDPQTDPSVRVMAGRLRQALENYNRERDGFTINGENVKIHLVKGSYVPKIELTQKTEANINLSDGLAALEEIDIDIGLNKVGLNTNSSKPKSQSARSSWKQKAATALILSMVGFGGYHYYAEHNRPTPTVLPEKQTLTLENATLPTLTLFVNIDSLGVPDWISKQKVYNTALLSFSGFNEFRVFEFKGEEDIQFVDISETDYYLSLFFSKASDNQTLEVVGTLTRPPQNEVIWSHRLVFPYKSLEDVEQNMEQVVQIASDVMSPYGVIHGDITSRDSPPPRLDCIRAIYSYFAREDLQAYANGLDCARRATKRPNASSSMYAMLTFMYVEAFRKQIIEVSSTPLEEAEEYARKAIRLHPGNARAYQALFAVQKARGNREEAISAARKAITLNPYDRDIIGDYAAYLVSINRQEQAKPILERALRLTPIPPAWLSFYAYLHADVTGNYKTADTMAKTFKAEDSSLLAVAIILSAQRQNDEERINQAINTLQITEPGFAKNPEKALLRRGFSDDFAADIAQRLEKAGLNKKLAKVN